MTKSKKLWTLAQKFVASGTQTYSKQPMRYVEGVYPYFIEDGRGCFVYSMEGNCYIDYVAALGANLLGYANEYVNSKVKERIDRGTLFSLPNSLEGQLAERLNGIFPYMEKMRFLKSGSEAVSAGVKLARAYTDRELIISIGYHGWHDWSSASSPKSAGSPERLKPTCINVDYNDMNKLKELFKLDGDQIAAIVMEPYVFDDPRDDYLRNVMKLAHRHGALVMFDEVVTGVRWRDYSVANFYELQPDLFALGKPLANGYPMAVIGGKARIMKELDKDCFVSSTFGGDLVGITAAMAVLDVCEQEDVTCKIYDAGDEIKSNYNTIAENLGLETSCIGNPARLSFKFPSDEHRALFWQESLKRGVLFGYATHTSLAHTVPIINKTIEVMNDSLKILKEHWNAPAKAIKGKIPQRVEVVGARR